MSFLPAVKFWIWLSVLASVAGWALSAIGMLNRAGYVIAGGVAAFAFVQALARGAVKFERGARPSRRRKLFRRFRRPFPLMFAALALLVLIGGLLYARSEEHTSELQSHSFISYAVF